MRKRDFGKISLPDTVPASLSDVFASIVPGGILLIIYTVLFMAMNAMGTTLPKLIYGALSPSLKAVDNFRVHHLDHTYGTCILVLRNPRCGPVRRTGSDP